jgi:hypothetical protein
MATITIDASSPDFAAAKEWFDSLPEVKRLKLASRSSRKMKAVLKHNPGLGIEEAGRLMLERSQAKSEKFKAELKRLEDEEAQLLESMAARRDCPICLERKDSLADMCRTKCGHNFCKPCWAGHAASYNRHQCPMCRSNPYTGAAAVTH